MAGLIAGAVRSFVGITGREAERAKVISTAEVDSVNAGARAAEREEERLLLENRVHVGGPVPTDVDGFNERVGMNLLVDAAGKLLEVRDGNGVIRSGRADALARYREQARADAIASGLKEGTKPFQDAVVKGVASYKPDADEAGREALEALARKSYNLEGAEPGSITNGMPLFRKLSPGQGFEPVSSETRGAWIDQMKVAEDAARSARIAEGEADAAKLSAWKYGAPIPVKVGVPLALAGGLGWGAVELMNDD